jgi:hypothetical protein
VEDCDYLIVDIREHVTAPNSDLHRHSKLIKSDHCNLVMNAILRVVSLMILVLYFLGRNRVDYSK